MPADFRKRNPAFRVELRQHINMNSRRDTTSETKRVKVIVGYRDKNLKKQIIT